jgi:hypothetical protein
MKKSKSLAICILLGFAMASCTFAPHLNQRQKVAAPTFSPGGGAVAAATGVSISCTTAGAAIEHWTNLDPTPVAGSSFSVSAACTLYAKATLSGYDDSDTASASYTMKKVAAPTFSPGGGAVAAATGVSISCTTIGAAIEHWTNLDPTPVVGSSFSVSAACTLYAKATLSTYEDSDTASASYTIASTGPANFHNQTVDIYEDFEDSTLAAGLTWEYHTSNDVTLSSTEHPYAGLASCKINHQSMGNQANILYFTGASNISAGFWFLCPTIASEAVGSNTAQIANPIDSTTSTYAVRVAVQKSSGAYHLVLDWGNSCTVLPGSWYWITYQYNGGGTSRLRVYDTSQTQILDASHSSPVLHLSELTLGTEQPENLPGTVVYYDEYVIDYTNHAFPILGW